MVEPDLVCADGAGVAKGGIEMIDFRPGKNGHLQRYVTPGHLVNAL